MIWWYDGGSPEASWLGRKGALLVFVHDSLTTFNVFPTKIPATERHRKNVKALETVESLLMLDRCTIGVFWFSECPDIKWRIFLFLVNEHWPFHFHCAVAFCRHTLSHTIGCTFEAFKFEGKGTQKKAKLTTARCSFRACRVWRDTLFAVGSLNKSLRQNALFFESLAFPKSIINERRRQLIWQFNRGYE